MKNTAPESAVLRRAELESDRIRIVVTLAILCVVFAFTFARRLVFAGTDIAWALAIGVAFFGAMVAYEAAMLWWVTRALRMQSDLPQGAWKANVVVEALFPTAGIALLVGSGKTGPYTALVAPIALTYFLFIGLSTLRLSPALARLSGVCSALGYVLVTSYVFARYPTPDVGSAMQPVEYDAGNTIIILAAGFVAGEVGRQIRRHVEATLREERVAARLRGELETARSIQQGLLPKETPRIPGYEIAGWNKPADETGGDFFDWQELPDQRFAFTLADVTGHGIGAALVAAASHAYNRACMAGDSDLGTIMGRVNGLLCAELPPGKLVTFVAGALDVKTGRLELLSAGHAPLILYTARRRPGAELPGARRSLRHLRHDEVRPAAGAPPARRGHPRAEHRRVLRVGGRARRGVRIRAAARRDPWRARPHCRADHRHPPRVRTPLCRRYRAEGRPDGGRREASQVRLSAAAEWRGPLASEPRTTATPPFRPRPCPA